MNFITFLVLFAIAIDSSTQNQIERVITKHRLNKNQTAYLIKETNLASPQKESNCKVKLDDGSTIDLTSLDRPSQPRYHLK